MLYKFHPILSFRKITVDFLEASSSSFYKGETQRALKGCNPVSTLTCAGTFETILFWDCQDITTAAVVHTQ